jgi:hypothetical protein
MKSLTVITVVAGEGRGLALTIDSILATRDCVESLDWVVVTRDLGEAPTASLDAAQRKLGSAMSVVQQTGSGIYQAMNQGQERVKQDIFMFINAGDTILDTIRSVEEFNKEKVHCLGSLWHNESGETLGKYKPFNPNLMRFGKGPSHQGMLFPRQFQGHLYQEHFQISGDLEMKLRLHSQDLLAFHDSAVSSCLVGGISGHKLKLNEILPRLREQRLALLEHHRRPWVNVLSLLTLLRFFIRTL